VDVDVVDFDVGVVLGADVGWVPFGAAVPAVPDTGCNTPDPFGLALLQAAVRASRPTAAAMAILVRNMSRHVRRSMQALCQVAVTSPIRREESRLLNSEKST
jgi:hypothetical protein